MGLPMVRAAAAACLLLVASACVSHSSLRRDFVLLVRQGRYFEAEAVLAKQGGRDEKRFVLDCLDRGMVLSLIGDHRGSLRYLDLAERRIEDLFTRDISDELAAIAWNDSSIAFQGEEFEKVMLNLLAAFNYLGLGQPEEAVVEARKINHNLKVYQGKLQRSNVTTFYVADGFASWFAGLLQEHDGSLNDAFISYRQALDGYRSYAAHFGLEPPRRLAEDLLWAANRLGFDDETRQLRGEFPDASVPPAGHVEGGGELVSVVGIGMVAHKESEKWAVLDPQGDTFIVTYPVFRPTPFMARRVAVLAGGETVHSVTAQPLSVIATRVMDDRNGQVKGRAIARAMASYLAQKAGRAMAHSDNSGVAALGLLLNIGAKVKDIAETADTRSWLSLPDNYQLARMWLPPGAHDVTVRYYNAYNAVMYEERRPGVEIRPGAKTFLFARSRE